MAKTPLSFAIPDSLPVPLLLDKLAENFPLQRLEQYLASKTFHDSFDWRLYNAGLLCEFEQRENATRLKLLKYKTGEIIYACSLEKIPRFVSEFSDALLIRQLQPLLVTRALLPFVSLKLQNFQLHILSDKQQSLVAVQIAKDEHQQALLTLTPFKNADKTVKRLKQLFLQWGLTETTETLFSQAIKKQGLQPGGYSAKLNITLSPDLSVQQAVVMIYKQLLQILKSNEQGMIEGIDSEFLHDFRVAVRRTRTGLGQLKTALPKEITEQYVGYFSWLGQITTKARDLDVYLLTFSGYIDKLSDETRHNLKPLRAFLQVKQSLAQQELIAHLSSAKYRSSLENWERYLNQPVSIQKNIPNLTVKQLADARIWKVYQQVMKQGAAITKRSPAAKMHRLRKSCKKLRYLIEFFQSLYPNDKIKLLLKSLKEFQDLLGDFQDCVVQQHTLRQFSAEMQENDYAEQTFLAIAELVSILELKSHQARSGFADCFARFAAYENYRMFEALFSCQKTDK